ncbi:hypothetical protein V8G54_004570 [Vigna mungo]|uniref:Uncharacterized protein n=1 Tax=Vigna mungo TaxID=3915 RepID=A0AAQ3SFD5_VIGMU
MSSPDSTKITWGVNPTPPAPSHEHKKEPSQSFPFKQKNQTQKQQELPRASSCFFPDPGGRPRCFFAGASAEAVPADSPPIPPPEATAEEGGGEAWVGARPRAMLPSGEYFRGRPRFFLASEHGFIGEEEPS